MFVCSPATSNEANKNCVIYGTVSGAVDAGKISDVICKQMIQRLIRVTKPSNDSEQGLSPARSVIF